MFYLIVKMFVLLLIAAAAGAALGWLYRGVRDREEQAAKAGQDAARLHDLRDQRDAAEAALADAKETAGAEAAEKLAAAEAALAQCQDAASKSDAKIAELEGEVARLNAAAAAPAPSPAPAAPEPQALAAVPETATEVGEPGAPKPMAQPADGGDDLRQISGVGPKIEGLLHEMGIWRFQQIADFTPAEVAWVDERLRFKGRIEREDWIAQAKTLAAGD